MRPLRWTVILAAVAVVVILSWAVVRGAGERALDLGERPGRLTGPRLVALRGDSAHCRALLHRAGVTIQLLPPRHEGRTCGYDDAVRFGVGGSRRIFFEPMNLGVSCPVAAALAMWEWDVVQPAALRHFGAPVKRIEHFGSYNCRRMYGRDVGSWSEHATANAVDIAGFRWADGRRVTVAADWRGTGAATRFLREVRTGACPLFATVLSPDYNAAHRDHLHLDEAARGGWGTRACR